MAIHRRAQALRHRRVVALLAFALASGCASAKPDNGLICKTWAGQGDLKSAVATGTVAAVTPKGFLLQLTGDCDLMVRVDSSGPATVRPNTTVLVTGDYAYNAMGGSISSAAVHVSDSPSP